MGKAARWLRSFLSAKKDRPPPPQAVDPPPPAPPKDKRWSFRRPTAAQGGTTAEPAGVEFDQKKHAVAAVAAAVAVARLSSRGAHRMALPPCLVEDAAAVRIQASFRGYLARTALCALRGIVKLQALVRGQLVRKQANATLRCMQALLAAQSHLRAQRMLALHHHPTPPPTTRPRQTPPKPRQSPRHRRSYEMDRSCEEDNAKIVEVDVGEPVRRSAGKDDRQLIADHHHASRSSPAPSAVTELMSPRGYSAHFDELSSVATPTAQSSPRQEACPGYMANTESSRAKARSQSAPRLRTDALERLPSRRKQGTPPRAARMQRSSSLVGGAAPHGGGHYSSSSGARLDVSTASLKDSECGSTSSVLTVYSRTRSLVGFEVRRGLY